MKTYFYKILYKDKDVIYVGVTTRTINKRFKEHLLSKSLNSKNYSVVEFDHVEHPEIKTLKVFYEEWRKVAELERKYIKEELDKGSKLLNISAGGEWGANIVKKLREENFLKRFGSYDGYQEYKRKREKTTRWIENWILNKGIGKTKRWVNHWVSHKSTNKSKMWVSDWVCVRSTNKAKLWISHWASSRSANKSKRWVSDWVHGRSRSKTSMWIGNWVSGRSANKSKAWISHWKDHRSTNKTKVWVRSWVSGRSANKTKIWTRSWIECRSYNKVRRWVKNWIVNRSKRA